MICSQTLILVGLGINTLASLFLLVPLLKATRNIDEEFIDKMDENGNYTQKKHKKDQIFSIVGFILFFIGFIFQIIGMTI